MQILLCKFYVTRFQAYCAGGRVGGCKKRDNWWKNPINKSKIEGKRILISSVTDPYKPFEEKYKVVRKLLKELSDADCEVVIQTKSDLILRDIDILKKMKNVTVAISLCSLNEKVAQDLEAGLSVASRLKKQKKLKKKN